jgi:DNA-nicking Smr family endonuclease
VGKGNKEFAARPFAAIKGLQVVHSPAEAAKPPAPSAPNPEPEDDLLLFLREMADVSRIRPIRKNQSTAVNGTKPAGSAVPDPVDADDSSLFLETLASLKLDVRFSDELPDGDRPVVFRPSNRLRQLRRGTIRLDLELDLHGLTREEALECLSVFIAAASRRGQQAVLVITGKGNNSPGEPVLQGAVAGWLRKEGKELVAEAIPAPPNLGGAGAFVVFLKTVRREP